MALPFPLRCPWYRAVPRDVPLFAPLLTRLRPVCVPGRDTLHRLSSSSTTACSTHTLLLNVLKGTRRSTVRCSPACSRQGPTPAWPTHVHAEFLLTISLARRVDPAGVFVTISSARRVHPAGVCRHEFFGTTSRSSQSSSAQSLWHVEYTQPEFVVTSSSAR